jgi:hypothetical protein
LLYNAGDSSFDVDDRVLAHLRIVFMNKLRRNEPFMFQIPDANVGTRSVWINAAVPLAFSFSGSRAPATDARWIDHLMQEASSPNGLTYEGAPGYDQSAGSAGELRRVPAPQP